jgi:hypothetical protein
VGLQEDPRDRDGALGHMTQKIWNVVIVSSRLGDRGYLYDIEINGLAIPVSVRYPLYDAAFIISAVLHPNPQANSDSQVELYDLERDYPRAKGKLLSLSLLQCSETDQNGIQIFHRKGKHGESLIKWLK